MCNFFSAMQELTILQFSKEEWQFLFLSTGRAVCYIKAKIWSILINCHDNIVRCKWQTNLVTSHPITISIFTSLIPLTCPCSLFFRRRNEFFELVSKGDYNWNVKTHRITFRWGKHVAALYSDFLEIPTVYLVLHLYILEKKKDILNHNN